MSSSFWSLKTCVFSWPRSAFSPLLCRCREQLVLLPTQEFGIRLGFDDADARFIIPLLNYAQKGYHFTAKIRPNVMVYSEFASSIHNKHYFKVEDHKQNVCSMLITDITSVLTTSQISWFQERMLVKHIQTRTLNLEMQPETLKRNPWFLRILEMKIPAFYEH